ncbi:MAG: alginate export family protein [Bacteroidales bacterium]|nr:alginate export family protein [Bacteroidales bacterium]
MRQIGITALLITITVISLKAQLTVNTELRPRGEIRHGYKSMFSEDDNAAYFISQRTRLRLTYNNEKYSLKITGQDVRVWGDEGLYSSTSVKGDVASIDLYEAWFQLNLGNYSFLKIGRQEWVYDDQRLLAKRNWSQTGLTYDGVLFKFDNKDFRADVGLSLNNDAENKVGNEYTSDKMKFLDFLYLSKKLGQSSVITFTGILSGYQKEEGSETVYVTATYGSYFKTNNKSFELEGSFFHQTGTNLKGQNINAFLFSVKGLYKFSEKFNLGPGIDFISGNESSSTSEKDHSFDVLYGARHRFLGEMDYFSDLSKSVSDAGIVDLFANANLVFNTKNSLSIVYHHFSTQKSVPDPVDITTDLKKSLGDEIDIMYKYKAEIPAELRIGLSLFNATKTMENLQGVYGNASNIQYFMYIQLSFSPEIFSSKN